MNEYYWFFLLNWFNHAIVTSIICVPLIIWNRRIVKWHWYELLAIVIPFWSWAFLIYYTDLKTKTMANVLEGYVIGVAILLYVVMRILLAKTCRKNVSCVALFVIVCLSGIVIYFVFPALPEPR